MKRWIALIAFTIALAPTYASAKIDKKLKEELETYLTPLAEETDPDARLGVYMSQALIDGKTARKALQTHATNEDKAVRRVALLALVTAGDKKAIEGLAKELASDATLLKTLEEYVALLEDKLELKVLARLLKDGRPEHRPVVARYLSMQQGELHKQFVKYLTGKDSAMKQEAVRAATALADTRVLGSMGKASKDKDEKIRSAALAYGIAVSERRSSRVEGIKFIKGFLGDSSAKLRDRAARKLVELNDSAGASALFSLMGAAKESSARQDTMRFLLEHNVKAKMADVKPYLEATDAEEKALAHQLAATSGDKDFAKKMIELEKSTEFDDRIIGIRAMGFTGSDTAATVLSRTLFEGRKDVRLASVRGLGKLANPKTLPALEKSLRGEADPEVKLEVIKALGSFKLKNAIRPLRFLVTNRDRNIRLAVLDSIRRIGLEDGASALDVLLRDRDREVQWNAFLTALQIKPDMGLKQLAKMMRNPSENYLQELNALEGKAHKQVFTYLLTKSSGSSQSDAIRWAMKEGGWDKTIAPLLLVNGTSVGDQRALMLYFVNKGDKGGMAATETIMRKSTDKNMRRLASRLLTRSPEKGMEPTFRGLVRDKDAAVKAQAVYGITRIYK